MDISTFYDKKIGILGYGREGRSTLNFLLDHGIQAQNCIIFDKQEVKHAAVPTRFGEDYLSDIGRCDIIFKSPGISPHTPALQHYSGVITTQTQLFFDIYPGKVIGITGTKGKTTITSLVGALIQQAGYTTKIIGNIGHAVLDEIDINTTYDYLVMELSSYQLHDLSCTMEIAVLNNLYHEHHITRHGSFEQYKEDKCSIVEKANYILIGSQIANTYPEVLKKDIPAYDIYGCEGRYTYQDDHFFIGDEKIFSTTAVSLLGKHNYYNICALLGIADKLHIDTHIVQHVVGSFKGVEHRLEYIGEYQGIHRINDAIATTPESTIAALETYKDEVDTIFLGGKEGNYDFTQLMQTVKDYGISNIVLFPDSGVRIAQTYDLSSYSILETTSMQEAVHFAATHTAPGKIALLSCASPSYSIWKNFEEKGRLFKEEIHKL